MSYILCYFPIHFNGQSKLSLHRHCIHIPDCINWENTKDIIHEIFTNKLKANKSFPIFGMYRLKLTNTDVTT